MAGKKEKIFCDDCSGYRRIFRTGEELCFNVEETLVGSKHTRVVQGQVGNPAEINTNNKCKYFTPKLSVRFRRFIKELQEK